jgi:hypothetical protein
MYPGLHQPPKTNIASWVRNKVSESEQQNRMTFMPFKDEIVWCGAYVQALTQAFEICKMCKTEEEKRIAAEAAANKKRAAPPHEMSYYFLILLGRKPVQKIVQNSHVA